MALPASVQIQDTALMVIDHRDQQVVITTPEINYARLLKGRPTYIQERQADGIYLYYDGSQFLTPWAHLSTLTLLKRNGDYPHFTVDSPMGPRGR